MTPYRVDTTSSPGGCSLRQVFTASEVRSSTPWRNPEWVVSMSPSSACIQLHPRRKDDIWRCSPGTSIHSKWGSGGGSARGPMYVQIMPAASRHG